MRGFTAASTVQPRDVWMPAAPGGAPASVAVPSASRAPVVIDTGGEAAGAPA